MYTLWQEKTRQLSKAPENELGNLSVNFLLFKLKLSIQHRFSVHQINRRFWKDVYLLRFVDQIKCHKLMLACCH